MTKFSYLDEVQRIAKHRGHKVTMGFIRKGRVYVRYDDGRYPIEGYGDRKRDECSQGVYEAAARHCWEGIVENDEDVALGRASWQQGDWQ